MELTYRELTVRQALRDAAGRQLEDGWIYFSASGNPGLDTVCLLVLSSEDDTQSIAEELNYPYEGLDTPTIEDTASAAQQFQAAPSDELLLESFIYYWRFDAWLPEPGAPEPPPWEETKLKLDRDFFDQLGPEREDVPCRAKGCEKGAVDLSVFCRRHHFEMIRKYPCPFTA